jgi:hypothetical protein
MFLSELLCAENDHFDFRGGAFNDEGLGASMTVTCPTSRTPDMCKCGASSTEGNSGSATAITTASLSTKMPCTNLVGAASGNERWQAARNNNPGGVNVCFGDGAIDVWRAIGSAFGGEGKGL